MRIAKSCLYIEASLLAIYPVNTDTVAAIGVDATPLLMIGDSSA